MPLFWPLIGRTKSTSGACKTPTPAPVSAEKWTSVFIDRDRYVNDDSLGYWVAHELGHLAANSATESAADKAAREYRKRLKPAHIGAPKRVALSLNSSATR